MSNHYGSYMLNDVLCVAEKFGIFEAIGEEKTLEFVLEVAKIGRKYDCNNGEMLRNIGQKIGICYCCLEKSNDFEDGLCPECRG